MVAKRVKPPAVAKGRKPRLEVVFRDVEELEAVKAAAARERLPVATWARLKLWAAASVVGALVLVAGCGPVYQAGRRAVSSPISSGDGAVWVMLEVPGDSFGTVQHVPMRCGEREDGSGWECVVVRAWRNAGEE